MTLRVKAEARVGWRRPPRSRSSIIWAPRPPRWTRPSAPPAGRPRRHRADRLGRDPQGFPGREGRHPARRHPPLLRRPAGAGRRGPEGPHPGEGAAPGEGRDPAGRQAPRGHRDPRAAQARTPRLGARPDDRRAPLYGGQVLPSTASDLRARVFFLNNSGTPDLINFNSLAAAARPGRPGEEARRPDRAGPRLDEGRRGDACRAGEGRREAVRTRGGRGFAVGPRASRWGPGLTPRSADPPESPTNGGPLRASPAARGPRTGPRPRTRASSARPGRIQAPR